MSDWSAFNWSVWARSSGVYGLVWACIGVAGKPEPAAFAETSADGPAVSVDSNSVRIGSVSTEDGIFANGLAEGPLMEAGVVIEEAFVREFPAMNSACFLSAESGPAVATAAHDKSEGVEPAVGRSCVGCDPTGKEIGIATCGFSDTVLAAISPEADEGSVVVKVADERLGALGKLAPEPGCPAASVTLAGECQVSRSAKARSRDEPSGTPLGLKDSAALDVCGKEVAGKFASAAACVCVVVAKAEIPARSGIAGNSPWTPRLGVFPF